MACQLQAGIPIYVGCTSTGLQYQIHGKSIPEAQLTTLLSQFGSMDTNIAVFLLCETNVSAPQVAQTLGRIQDAGLHTVIMMVAAVQGGTSGVFQVTIDCAKHEFGESCGLGEKRWTSGFQAEPEEMHMWGRYLLDKGLRTKSEKVLDQFLKEQVSTNNIPNNSAQATGKPAPGR